MDEARAVHTSGKHHISVLYLQDIFNMWFFIASYLVPQAQFMKYENPLRKAADYVQTSITSNCLVSLEESEIVNTS